MIYFLKKKKEALNEEKYQQSNTSVNSKKKYQHTETHPQKKWSKTYVQKKGTGLTTFCNF